MPKPVCVPCRRFFRMRSQGCYFVEGMPNGEWEGSADSLPRGRDPNARVYWQPYKIWAGDLWECKGCGAQILSGFGLSPIDVQHTDTFKDNVQKFGADQLQVNDC